MEEQTTQAISYNGWKWKWMEMEMVDNTSKTLCIFKTCGYKLIVTWSLFPGKTIASYGKLLS